MTITSYSPYTEKKSWYSTTLRLFIKLTSKPLLPIKGCNYWSKYTGRPKKVSHYHMIKKMYYIVLKPAN